MTKRFSYGSVTPKNPPCTPLPRGGKGGGFTAQVVAGSPDPVTYRTEGLHDAKRPGGTPTPAGLRGAGRRCPAKARRHGSTTLEFAILLPLLLTITMICVDFGRFAHSYIAVTNAARAGAGFGSFHPVTPATKPVWDALVLQAVQDDLENNSWYDVTQVTMPAPDVIDEPDGTRRVRVDVSYPFQTLVNWPFLPGYNDPVTLRKIVVMRFIR